MKYRLSQIATITGGRLVGEDREVCSVATDSRSLSCELGAEPLFVAMHGQNHDSHDYLGDVAARGVKAFMVEHEVPLEAGAGAVVVPRSLEALQQLAAYHRALFRGCVVGITGSNGKTVIKEWIAEELPAGVKFYRSPKSYNSQLGVPLSVLMLEGDEELAIFEAGISQQGEMERLERIIRPDVVILTSLGDAHQEHFVDAEQKAREKLVLARSSRTIIYHSHYETLARVVEGRYAERTLIDAASFEAPALALVGSEASRRNAQLVEAFLAAMHYPAPSFASVPQVAMRLEVKEGIHSSLLVNDAYNLDLNSLALALDYLHTVAGDRPKMLILSDIAQSNLPDEALYGRVAKMVCGAGIERLVGIGSRIARQAAQFDCPKEFYTTTDECIERLSRRSLAGAAVLLKGARTFRFEKLAHALSEKSHTTLLEVNLDAMMRNLNRYTKHLKEGTRLVAMVKASSYGAGDFEVAQTLQHHGVAMLAVAFTDEGVLLRERGIRMPIVVLNADADSFEQMIAYRLEPEIYSLHSLACFVEALSRSGDEGYPIHLKLDTGMHRLGFEESDLEELIERLKSTRAVRVATLFTHLSVADDPTQDDFTREQIERFEQMSGVLKAALDYPILCHAAATAAMVRFREAQYDLCRLGIGLYGYGYSADEPLEGVSTLKTRIVQLKKHPAGTAIGYGRQGVLARDSVVATIPIGYADGLDRHLGCGRWSMLIGGVEAPIVGRVCMDSCMIDVTDAVDVKEGDEVVVFSPRKGNDAAAMAEVLGTIPYEVLTSVSGRVKRIYIKE
ncbi:MAG: alanine racemase [Rikenellaceae bacterium]|nr:alanine racemase [Rikenellaceae bacterium]